MTYADSDYLEAVIAAGPEGRKQLIANKRAEIQDQIDYYNEIAQEKRDVRRAWWKKSLWTPLEKAMTPVEKFFDSVFAVGEAIGYGIEGLVVAGYNKVAGAFKSKKTKE